MEFKRRLTLTASVKMGISFEIVEQKLFEADFFLERLNKSGFKMDEARYYFSAFLSSARSVTFTLQASLSDTDEFKDWYEIKQKELGNIPLAKFFLKARNDSQKVGLYHINIGRTLNNNTEYFFAPFDDSYKFVPETDLYTAGKQFLKILLEVVYDCFQVFGEIIDPEKHYSIDAIKKRGQTVKDIEYEVWGYNKWTDFGISEEETLKYILNKMVKSTIDILFVKYLGKTKNGETIVNEKKPAANK